ncbi:MAG: DNA translocase FtsK [Eubacteriales bacterium]
MPTKKTGSKPSTKRKTTTRKKPTKKQTHPLMKEFKGVILIAVAIALAIAVYSDGIGMVGAFIKNLVLGLSGVFAFALAPLLFIIGVFMIADFKSNTFANPSTFYIIGYASLVSLIHTISFDSLNTAAKFPAFVEQSYIAGAKFHFGGGALGALISHPVNFLMGKTGCYLIFILGLILSLMVITNFSIKAMVKNLKAAGATAKKNMQERRASRPEPPQREVRPQRRETRPTEPRAARPKKKKEMFVFEASEGPVKQDGELDEIDRISTRVKKGKRPVVVPNQIEDDTIVDRDVPKKNIKITDMYDAEEAADAGLANETEQALDDALDEAEPYVKPPYALLKAPPSKRGRTGGEAKLREQAQVLEETLRSFNLDANVVNICRGPVVTRFEVVPAPGVRVSRIVSLADDIALNLAAQSIRIEAPIPGRAAIGIEVPNDELSTVYLKELIDSTEFRNTQGYLTFGLGKDISGKKIFADIAKMPHLLVAGATGAGKSVCINSLIMSVLYNAAPEDVRMILIDPKVVELSVFNNIPHLLVPVVTDPKKAASAVTWAVVEMQRRYQVLAADGSRNIDEYNDKAFAEGEKKMPKIIVVIDELADLMKVSARELEDAIYRIAQLGRACGIHLILATQRPSVDVITGTIKANIPSRIAFAVSSHTDSRTIIDMGGAEKLLGKGDMLFYPTGKDQPVRVQGCFVTNAEVRAVAEFLKSEKSSHYDKNAVEDIKNGSVGDSSVGGGKSDDTDELLPKAVEIVLEHEQASISMLQRRLRVGYARAARLIDEMEVRGIVSRSEGPKPRQVLIGWEQYNDMFKGN